MNAETMSGDENASRVSGDSSLIAHRSSLQTGVALFNDQRFWHAHEAWEGPWLQVTGDAKEFLQGLIQLAAAYHHVQRGTFRGGVRLFDAALRRLAPFPDRCFDIERGEVVKAAAVHREKIARGEQIVETDFPKFR